MQNLIDLRPEPTRLCQPQPALLRELAAEPVRVPMTDEKFEEFIEQFRWYDGDVDRYDIQGFARELLRAHGIV